MTEQVEQDGVMAMAPGDGVSLLAIGNVMLRRGKFIAALAAAFGVLGGSIGLLSKRVYAADATFIPNAPESASSGIALAASQLGIRIPQSGGAWSAAVYVEIMKSREILERLALDTLAVEERSGKSYVLVDLLEVPAQATEMRTARAVATLSKMIDVTEDKKLGAVRLEVSSQWPSVSFSIALRLLGAANRFNVERRRSQATAERQFLEQQSKIAEGELRSSEDALERFLVRNRSVGNSPDLLFERDRLQRAVQLRQQVYTALMQGLDEAKVREIRDTPTMTILEDPRLPVAPRPRGTLLKATVGVVVGALIGTIWAFLSMGLAEARKSDSEEAREFFSRVAAISKRITFHA